MSIDEQLSGALPPPPWARRRPRRPASKAPLTRTAIVDVALEILDSEGLDGISMRRVAERLDTGPASLYQHIADKEELLEELLDRVAGEIELPEPDPSDWQTPLKAILRSMRRVLSSHRDIAYVTLGRIPTGPHSLRSAERVLAIMRAGGVPPRIAAYAVDALVLFVGAVSYEEAIQARTFEGRDAEAYFASVNAYFAALPRDRFPTLVAMADELMHDAEAEDARFEFALDVQVRGIAALVTAHEREHAS